MSVEYEVRQTKHCGAANDGRYWMHDACCNLQHVVFGLSGSGGGVHKRSDEKMKKIACHENFWCHVGQNHLRATQNATRTRIQTRTDCNLESSPQLLISMLN